MTPSASAHFADRLGARIDDLGAPVCVGLDPVLQKLPAALRTAAADPASAIETYSLGVIDAIAGVVPAVKIQSACYERYGSDGLRAMQSVCAAAREAGLLVILDAKRGDIGVSASHYAAFAFEQMDADALTVSAYLGFDTLEPYLEMIDRLANEADNRGRALFNLVRTSNPGSDAVQNQRLEDGRTVAEMIADHTARIGADRVGARGYSDVGAVVAATKPEDARAMRKRMPSQLFLVPGYGAQGGTHETVRDLFNENGTGALITASRSVIYAFNESASDWQGPIRIAATQLAEQIAALTSRGH